VSLAANDTTQSLSVYRRLDNVGWPVLITTIQFGGRPLIRWSGSGFQHSSAREGLYNAQHRHIVGLRANAAKQWEQFTCELEVNSVLQVFYAYLHSFEIAPLEISECVRVAPKASDSDRIDKAKAIFVFIKHYIFNMFWWFCIKKGRCVRLFNFYIDCRIAYHGVYDFEVTYLITRYSANVRRCKSVHFPPMGN